MIIVTVTLAVLIVVLFPLLIAVGTSADIFMWVTNDNDWIGFWGDYVAMLVGGAITLYVLFKSLADSRNTMQETLANERKIQEYNEIRQFGDLLIEKSAAFSVKLEEMTYKAPYCIYGKGKPEYINYISDFSKEFRIVRSILIEISMHLEVIDGKKSYYTEKGKQLSETVENLMLILNKYHKKILEQERDEEIEKTICDLSNDLINQTQDFLKEIV